MPFRIKATLKGGKVLEVEFADRETVDAELRCIDRWRKARWGLPCISWTTVEGERWVVSPYDFAGPLEVYEVEAAVAVAS